MTRGRHWKRGIALVACASASLAALPATAGAQSAVDEYTLDLPGGGSSSTGSGGPSAGSSGAGAAGASTGKGAKAGGAQAGRGDAADASGAGGGDASGVSAGFAPFHEGVGRSTDTGASSRSAPEVVADTLLDGAMLPLLAALVLITGVGAWRVLRHRRTLTGAAG